MSIHTLKLIAFLLLLCPAALATPPSPVNTPRAHPLAPNPHTSVGLFWIYTDANTGRQWTGGTYKVKRCAGAGCTPTTVIASSLTNADYQDTGLSTNTTYGYRYVANDGTDSADSPTVYVTTLAADSNFVQFPDTKWSELLGPQVESAQIPFAYYDNAAKTTAQAMIAQFAVAGPGPLLGTGAITNGTTIITGTNTKFLEQVAANNPACLDAISIDGVSAGAIASVDSNTQITLSTTWTGGTKSNALLSTNVTGLCGFTDPINDMFTGNQLGYYDSPWAMWQLYYRTGDPQYIRGAIKFSESIFAGYLWLGRNRAWNSYSTTPSEDNMPAPRNFQFGGYALLGLAGHNGVWDLLDKYLEARYQTFLINYRGGDNDFLYTREKGYMILYASIFVTAAPDTFPRSNGTTTSLNGASTVDGDLVDGRKDFYRDQLDIDVPGFILDDQAAAGEWYEMSAGESKGSNDMPYPPGTGQSFIEGLVTDALGYCWRNSALSTTARNAARKEVLRAAAFMATRAINTNIAADDTSHRWNTMWYFIGGGTRLNPYALEHGSDSSILNNTPDSNMIAQYRQGIPLMLATFGWAYEMSGKSLYLTWGDALANAAFAAVGENTGGTGDGLKSLCDNSANYKDFGQCYRSAAKYFANRLESPASLGTLPTVTMPSNVTLTSGVNQTSLTASVGCTNSPCTYKWYLVEYPLMLGRQATYPTFSNDAALTTTISGLENGVYKIGFYTLDSFGMAAAGTVNVTVGDGVFPPVVTLHKDGIWWGCTTSSSFSGIQVRAYSAAGRSLTHSFSVLKPKDATAPTITPSGTTGNFITVTVSGMSAAPSWYTLKDVVTDSAGVTRVGLYDIAVQGSCGSVGTSQPTSTHNTIPTVLKQPDHVLPNGASSTVLFVVPHDPEGASWFQSAATGYTLGYNGDYFLVTALSHSWAQIAGPTTATITNGSTIRPTITGMTAAGTYTFRYTGVDQQGDSVTTTMNVTVSGTPAPPTPTICNWHTSVCPPS